MNKLVKLGYFISGIGFAYETKGFKGAFNYMRVMPTMALLKYIYNHTKWGNKLIKKRVNKNIISPILLSDIMFNYENIDWEEFYNSLSEEEKEKYSKSVEEIINKTIEEYNITDEDLIKLLKKSFIFNKSKI